MKLATISARKLGAGEPQRECHAEEPGSCEPAAYEITLLGHRSYLCDRHFWRAKVQLDAGAPCTIVPGAERVGN